MDWRGRKALLLASWLGWLSLTTVANTRTLESPFALSADTRSEFSLPFQVFSGGRIVIEGDWRTQPGGAYPLRIALVRPDGSEAARREGLSPLRLEYAISQTEADKFNSAPPAKWTPHIINSVTPNRPAHSLN